MAFNKRIIYPHHQPQVSITGSGIIGGFVLTGSIDSGPITVNASGSLDILSGSVDVFFLNTGSTPTVATPDIIATSSYTFVPGQTGSIALPPEIADYPAGGFFDVVTRSQNKLRGFSNRFRARSGVNIPIEYLIVAGGGGGATASGGDGAAGGGGGAGGMVTGNRTIESDAIAQTWTITVGAGGAGSTDNTSGGGQGASGNDSSIAGTGWSGSVAIGGGGAGSRDTAGLDGGSGGGINSGDQGLSIGYGVPGQGNNGGDGGNPVSPSVGGGGGGAGSVGQTTDYNQTTVGGNGGDGLASSITGTSLYYAGGGGGGGGTGAGGSGGSGVGGSGADGNGGTSRAISAPNDATANRGGGGGGSAGGANGANGADGVVIIRYLTQYDALLTPAGTYAKSTTGNYTVLKWTGSGTLRIL